VGGVILEEVNQVGNVIEVIDGCDSEFLGVGDCCAEHEATDTTETVDTDLD